ncbi:MAG: SAM-dependent methyltransferase [Desulfobacterales bacterium]|nr:SAM-dependent methyltransferase [Desulfobacterales bacterium]
MNVNEWNPPKLLELSGSYWKTCTLHAGVKLNIFTIIGNNSHTVHEISIKLNTSEDATLRLLNALVAMNLLIKNGNKYENTEASKTFLSKDSPKYIGYIIMHHHHLLPSWAQLDLSIKSGKPIRNRSTGDITQEQRESFLMGMFNIAMNLAPIIVKEIDLKGKTHLLDLGGGPGTYAIHFCLANPSLKATVYDLPTTEPFFKETVKKFGLSDRINFISGNYVKDKEIFGKYDAVWISHILHGESYDTCLQILKKASETLNNGAMVMIHEFILNNTLDSPLHPALFSLNMLLGTEGGRSYSEGELMDMLKSCGLIEIFRHPFKGPMDSGIVMGIIKSEI